MPTNGQLKFLSRVKSLSQEEKFCDVKIEFSDGNRKFNSLVLASLSPFFEAMLSSSMKEGLTGEVSLPTVSVEVFDAVMSYYMDGEGELDEKALYEAVDACEMMELPDLKDVCILNMKENLNVDSCVRIWQLSQKYTEDQKLVQNAFKMVVKNIGRLSSQEDFLRLSKAEVYEIVTSERTEFMLEPMIFEAVLKWTEVNEPEETNVIELINKVRFQHISKSALLKKVLQYSETLNKNKSLLKAIQEYAVDDDEKPNGSSLLHKVIVVCSSSDKPILHVHAWHLTHKKWYDLSTTIPEPRTQFSASSVGTKIVVTGGNNKDGVLSETLIYDSFENKWEKGPDLNTARCRHASVEGNGKVFVFGGTNGKFLNSIEMLNTDINQWETVGNLATPVADPEVTNVGQYVLVMGGYNMFIKENKCLELQCFDVQNKSTIAIKSKLGYVRKAASESSTIFLITEKGESVMDPLILQRVLLEVQNNDLSFHPQQIAFKNKGFGTKLVVSDEQGYFFSDSSTQQISVRAEEKNKVILPTIPGPVSKVCSAFIIFVGDKSIHRASS